MDTLEYWDDFYEDRPKAYDTLWPYAQLRSGLLRCQQFANSRMRNRLRVLHIGCGTSDVTEGLVRDGAQEVANIDFSSIAIDVMAARWAERQDAAKASWHVADAADLSVLGERRFDLAIEKFTLDAILCMGDASGRGNAAVCECHKFLVSGGCFISVAWASPEERLPLLRRAGLSTALFEVAHPSRLPVEKGKASPYVYVCHRMDVTGISCVPSAPEDITNTDPKSGLPSSEGAFVQVFQTDTEVVVQIQFQGPLSGVVPDKFDVDLAEQELRWHSGEPAGTGVVTLPCRVNVGHTKARWKKDSGNGSSRRLVVTMPFAP